MRVDRGVAQRDKLRMRFRQDGYALLENSKPNIANVRLYASNGVAVARVEANIALHTSNDLSQNGNVDSLEGRENWKPRGLMPGGRYILPWRFSNCLK